MDPLSFPSPFTVQQRLHWPGPDGWSIREETLHLYFDQTRIAGIYIEVAEWYPTYPDTKIGTLTPFFDLAKQKSKIYGEVHYLGEIPFSFQNGDIMHDPESPVIERCDPGGEIRNIITSAAQGMEYSHLFMQLNSINPREVGCSLHFDDYPYTSAMSITCAPDHGRTLLRRRAILEEPTSLHITDLEKAFH